MFLKNSQNVDFFLLLFILFYFMEGLEEKCWFDFDSFKFIVDFNLDKLIFLWKI